MISPGTVYLVGAGPGDPGLITRRGLDILRAADVVVYDRLLSPELLLEARPDARTIYVGKAASRHALAQDEINELLAEEAKAGHSVCRLKGGDPLLFGRGGEEADHLAQRGIAFVVVPGVTSAIAAPAYAGIPVTDRRAASSLAIVTGHDDVEKERDNVDWANLAHAADTLVVLMGMKNVKAITEQLLEAGKDKATPAAAIRWGTTGMQETVTSDLSHIAEEVEARGLTPPAVLVVGEVVGLAPRLAWFDRRPLRGLRVLVTRPRHQAGTLADRLREAGAEPVVCPLIRIEPVEADADRIRTLFEQQWDWVLFTSANAVTCFGRQLRAAGLDWRSLAGARLGAIGPGTAAALETLGIKVDFVPPRAVAESLGERLPEVPAGARVLLPRAAEARDALPETLRERGASVETITTYRTLHDEEGAAFLTCALEKGEIDVVTLTSSSGVRALVEAAGAEALSRCTIACIGPITAETARTCGLRVDVEADEHTIPGLVEALERCASQRREQCQAPGGNEA